MNMDADKPTAVEQEGGAAPVTEADLHAHVDGRLTPARRAEVEQYLATRPQERERVADWQQQNEMLRALLDPVAGEPLPLRLPLRAAARSWPWRGLAAGALIAALSAGLSWSVRGALDADAARLVAGHPDATRAAAVDDLAGFAHRAAIAHVVFSPDVRRPVEVTGDQEQALVTWLTRRMGTAVRPASLSALGYALIGGRLLPGGQGPVAQFMYEKAGGHRLTLYVTREVAGQDLSFRFGHDGPVNVFYWVDDRFGYAISAGADRAELMRVAEEVYRQLKPG